MTDYDPNSPERGWTVSRTNDRGSMDSYWIEKDTSRPRTAPKWLVQRVDDLKVSKRYYSRAAGAFLALSEGAIVWED